MIRIIILTIIAFSAPTKAWATEFNQHFINAARAAKESVVNIIIYNSVKRNDKISFSRVGYGSGTIISKHGHIVTNYHVLKKGNYYQAVLYDGSEFEFRGFNNGSYYYADEKTDIALMRIDDNLNEFKPIAFGDSDKIEEGEWLIAIGNPYGLGQSITCGIVSSKGRSDIGFAEIEDFIQTDVPINPGNSGGPLINLKGRMIGMNTAIRTISGGYQGISFAIPSNIVKKVAGELRENGRVRRGWLGFLAREKKISNIGESKIVEIISVIKNSPAEAAGIYKNDIIKEIDGKRIRTLGELIKIVGNKSIGENIRISASRDGYLREFNLMLREKNLYRNMQKRLKELYLIYGIELDENTNSGDLVISYLSPMREGYQRGLKRGDNILSLNGSRAQSLEIFLEIFNKNSNRISEMEINRAGNVFNVEFVDNER